jgi:hypothetical protein
MKKALTILVSIVAFATTYGAQGGFWRIADVGGHDSFVAPDGATRFLAGVCHVHPRGSHSHALGYSPYGRFCATNYPSPAAWADETAARLSGWGFNALGAACDTALLAGSGFPHVSNSALRMGQSFATDEPEHSICPFKGAPCTALPNVFHPDFAAHCEKIATERCAAAKDDPLLLGWYIDNELAWWAKSGSRATGVYDAVAALPPEHSARRELERFLAGEDVPHRGTEAQRTSLSTNSQCPQMSTNGNINLCGSVPLCDIKAVPGETKLAFLAFFAERYFSVTTAAIRRHDPNHLILGCRFAGIQGAHPVVWEEAGRFCDIVSFNCYPWADLDRNVVLDEKCGVPMSDRFREYHGYAGRPLYVTEWSFPALDTGRPCLKGAGQRVPTQRERAAASALFLRTMLAEPHVVGCDWFMWCDRPAQGGHKANAEDCNYGLVNEQGEPYEELIAAISPILRNAGEIRNHGTNANVANVEMLPMPISNVANFNVANAEMLPLPSSSFPNFNVAHVDAYTLSNAFVRISGRVGSAYLADEIAFGDKPVGRFGALLHAIVDGDRIYADITRVTNVGILRDDATGVQRATIRAEGSEGGISFAITFRFTLAPSSREVFAAILAIENLGDRPIEAWEPFMRPWSLVERPEAVPHVLDAWGQPLVAEWRLPGGGAWGVRSSDLAAKRFRFFIDANGRQHPDVRFHAVDGQGRSAVVPIAPGETWRPATPMTATVFWNPDEEATP